ncbi:uncharacterized protein LOC144132441 [Amblyomma americanum]
MKRKKKFGAEISAQQSPTRLQTLTVNFLDTRMDPNIFYGKIAAKAPPEHSDDSDLESSSDEEPENAPSARASLSADCQDEGISRTPSTDNIEEIPKPSKNGPAWSVVQGSTGNTMPKWKDVPPCSSPVESIWSSLSVQRSLCQL